VHDEVFELKQFLHPFEVQAKQFTFGLTIKGDKVNPGAQTLQNVLLKEH
jgi:hypothetical protein